MRRTKVGVVAALPSELLTVITPPNSMQPTALRTAADAERWTDRIAKCGR